MQRCLAARVGADQQAGVGLVDAGDRRVEQVARRGRAASSLAPSWRQSTCGDAEPLRSARGRAPWSRSRPGRRR